MLTCVSTISGKKKEASTLNKQNKDSAKDGSEPADLTANNEKKKRKKKKKKKKAEQGGGEGGVNAEGSEPEQNVSQSTTTEKPAPSQSSVSSVKVTESPSEPGLLSEVTVTEETSQSTPNKELPEELSKKKLHPAGEQQTPVRAQISSEADAVVSGKKKKKGLKLETDVDESQVNAETPVTDTRTSGKKKKKSLNAEKDLEEVEDESQFNGVSVEEDSPAAGPEKPIDSATPGKKKGKKKNLKAVEAADAPVEGKLTEITSAADVPLKKKKKGKQQDAALKASPAADESAATPLKKKRNQSQEESKTAVEEDGAEWETPQEAETENLLISKTTPAKKKKKKPSAAKDVEIQDESPVQLVDVSSGKPAQKKKKRKIPVVFEFEADELEAAASVNGLAREQAAVKKTKLVSVSF